MGNRDHLGIRAILPPKNIDIKTFKLEEASNCDKLLMDWDKFISFRNSLTEEEKDVIDFDWEGFWARKNQKEPKTDFFIWLLLMGRGGGKRLSLDTEIPTTNGWKLMGELKVGDKLFADNGSQCNVTFVSDVCENPDLYKVTFDDGNIIYADAEHNWFVWPFNARKARQRKKNPILGPVVVTTQQMINNFKYKEMNNWAIELCGEAQYDNKDLPIHPYYLGVWLSQRSFSFDEVNLPTKNLEIVKNITDAGYVVSAYSRSEAGNNTLYRVGAPIGRNLKNDIISLDLVGRKFIPNIYLQSSRTQRLQLFRGILDTIGDLTSEGKIWIEHRNNSLVSDFKELACSLGLKVFKKKRSDGICVASFVTDKIKCFTVESKSKVQDLNLRATHKHLYRYITKIEKVVPAESKPAQCISVDSHNNTYLCTRDYITTHNTRTGSEWIRKRVMDGTARKIALVARSPQEVRDVMIKGQSGMIETSAPGMVPVYNRSNRSLKWPNGAEATIFTSYDPDQLRGHQFDTAWCDELAAWKYLEDTWNMLMMGLRLKDGHQGDPKCIVTTTPRPLPIIKKMLENDSIPKSFGSTFYNQLFLAPSYIKHMKETYEGTRLGRQELHGDLLGDVQGALWTSAMVEETRIDIYLSPESFPGLSLYEKKMNFIKDNIIRIVIGVDPQMVGGGTNDEEGSAATANCETGIIVAGVDSNGHGYILEDISGNYTPNDWAKKVCNAFHKYSADRIIAETNQGGDIVIKVIRNYDDNVNVKDVFAKKGKYLRAEPISALYERGKIHHFGSVEEYAKLESQMINWVPGDASPDRLDAAVYALTELMLDSGPTFSGFIGGDDEDVILKNPYKMFEDTDTNIFGNDQDARSFFDLDSFTW